MARSIKSILQQEGFEYLDGTKDIVFVHHNRGTIAIQERKPNGKLLFFELQRTYDKEQYEILNN